MYFFFSYVLLFILSFFLIQIGDDFLQVGNSLYRIARGVSVAGVLLSTLGIVVDVAFLGSALLDLNKEGKGKLGQSLSSAADVMEIMNQIIKELN